MSSETITITKTQICAQIANRTGQREEDVKAFYATLVDVVKEGLWEGKCVSLTGIGTLKVGTNKKGKIVRFSSSDELRGALKFDEEDTP